MPIPVEHPLYTEYKDDWAMMRDAYKGERHVKAAGTKYLPATSGMVLDGMLQKTQKGAIDYEAYLMRAVFPDHVQVGVETLVGILSAKEWTIKLPPELEYLRERATNQGDSLPALIRRINEQQLTTGRCGLLGDLPIEPDPINPQVYLALYTAESIVNWDDGDFGSTLNKLNLVILNESAPKREPSLQWIQGYRWRVLQLGDGSPGTIKGQYAQGIFETATMEFTQDAMSPPTFRGNTLDEIPFVFVNSKDNLAVPDVPPLLGLGRLCFTIYRAEADYRQTLFLQGQDTLVVIGGAPGSAAGQPDDALRIGAGARIDVSVSGDAKFIGVSSDGLSEQREALNTDYQKAAVRTGQLLAPGKMSMESGEALKTRVAAQTSTLTSVALSSAAGLKAILRVMAKWVGADPTAVDVLPNLDFTNADIQGQDVVQLITAKNLGWPISYQTLHAITLERGLVKTTFEEEMALIQKDPQLLITRAIELAAGLKGNNPLEAAGGPKATPRATAPPSNAQA